MLVVVGCSKSSNNESNGSGGEKPNPNNPTPPPVEPEVTCTDDEAEVLKVGDQEFHFLISKTSVDEYRIIFKEIKNAQIPLQVHLPSASMGFLGGSHLEGCKEHYDIFKNPEFANYLESQREMMGWSAGQVSAEITEWIDKNFQPENSIYIRQKLETLGWDRTKSFVIQYPEAKEVALTEDNFWIHAHKTPNRLLMALNRPLEITLADYCGILLGEANIALELPQKQNCETKKGYLKITR